MLEVVALAAVAALTLCVLGFAGVLRSLIRQHARERDLLIDKMMHLAGRTWTPPPAGEPVGDTGEDFGSLYSYTPALDSDYHAGSDDAYRP